MPKTKFYAVRIGREGPKVYDTWQDTERAVRGYPNSRHKSFQTKEQANEWIQAYLQQPPQPKLTETNILKRLYAQCLFVCLPVCTVCFGLASELIASVSTGDEENQASHSSQHHQQPPNKRHQVSLKDEITSHHLSAPSSKSESNTTVINKNSNLPSKKAFSPEEDYIPLVSDTSAVTCHSSSHAPDFTPSNLSPDQANVFTRVLNGRSVFFTGSAGTGKSHLLKLIIRHLSDNLKKQVFVTASTGIAASLIKGTTLHSFAGLGLANEDVPKLINKLRNSVPSKRWTAAHVLIVDEVSMIDGNFFNKLNQIAKSIRGSSLPFGGIQLILTGDFFQLPPVTRSGCKRVPYIFETDAWQECITEMLVLKHVFRQSDQAFVDILNEIRYGHVSERTTQVMRSLQKEVHYSDGIQPAELYPTTAEVQQANNLQLAKLDSPKVLFKSKDRPGERFSNDPNVLRAKLDKNTLVAEQLILKVGAQVMLVKNLQESGLVNGSIGIITAFVDKKYLETFDENATTHDSTKFENDHQGWPKVLFTNGTTKVLTPHDFDVEDPLGRVEATRVQVPLILAWALSIHKSQGQSLDRVKINLTRSFEAGQVYVALSRATSLKAIQVIGFDQRKVIANSFVLKWAKEFLD